MKLDELVQKNCELFKGSTKNDEQKRNINTISKIATDFHIESNNLTNGVKEQIKLLRQNKDIVIIEVAHQSNFMPYYGVWKKAVFADFLAKMLNKKGIPAVALFGFVDNDTTMSSYLSSNKIPYGNKEGYKKIGFKIKGENEWWRQWCKQPLPSREKIEKQINFMMTTYTDNGLLRDDGDLKLLEKLFRECYLNNHSFSKANALFFSAVCNRIFDLNVVFFNYSDAIQNNVFNNEINHLFKQRKKYIDINNKFIELNDLNIDKMSEEHVPFWYHCACGGKVRLKINELYNILYGNCPFCKHHFEKPIGINYDLNDIYKSISFEAISRELVVPNALGTDVYIEGSGGSLSFRQIYHLMADEFNFKKPLSLRWKSKDAYISLLLHQDICNFVQKYPVISIERDMSNLNDKIKVLFGKIDELNLQCNHLGTILKECNPKSKEFDSTLILLKNVNIQLKNHKREFSKLSSIVSKINGIKTAYAITPSILDEILSVGFDEVLKCWLSDIKKNDFDIQHTINLPVKNTVEDDYELNRMYLEILQKLNLKEGE